VGLSQGALQKPLGSQWRRPYAEAGAHVSISRIGTPRRGRPGARALDALRAFRSISSRWWAGGGSERSAPSTPAAAAGLREKSPIAYPCVQLRGQRTLRTPRVIEHSHVQDHTARALAADRSTRPIYNGFLVRCRAISERANELAMYWDAASIVNIGAPVPSGYIVNKPHMHRSLPQYMHPIRLRPCSSYLTT